jgi:RecB family endonuclease NucS
MKKRAKPHVEIKTGKYIDSSVAKKLAEKGGVIGVVATGKITGPAKKILQDNQIAWAEYVTEKALKEKESGEQEREP